MAIIHPFKAIRPTRDKVHLVASRPYYSYKKSVLKAKLMDNPYTFMHIITPDFDKVDKSQPNSLERFNRVSKSYESFLANGVLIQDSESTLYIYRQTKKEGEFLGVIGGASIEEYKTDRIKKHEATITSREELFTNYLDIVGYNAEPVLLAHPDSVEIDQLINEWVQERPEYEFSTTDDVKHELWVLNAENCQLLKKAFSSVPNLYIADGHHRSASSVGLFDLRKQKGTLKYPNEAYFLAYFISESRLRILEFNRLVKTMNAHSEVSFLDAISVNFEITLLDKASKPKQEHEITVCIQESWFSIKCKPHIIIEDDPIKSLDAEILTEYILRPVLGIDDLKTDENISFISGAEPLSKIEKKIAKADAEIAFILFPATMQQVRNVADHNMIMPPKSTWVEPKLRSGLTIYNVNE